jgi:DNA-binding transcriptional MerR regulator
MADDLTIDELARRAGTRTTTVRLYQTKGLLPPPEIRGRLGYYNAAHLARLRVIDRLQKRGCEPERGARPRPRAGRLRGAC